MNLRLSHKLSARPLHNILLCILLIPALLFTSHTINRLQHEALNEERISSATSDMRERIARIHALMASLVGLRQSTTGPLNSAMYLFHEQIREQADYVANIGSYDHLSHDDRRSFESHHARSGNLNYEITGVDQDGQNINMPESAWYYPISIIEPLLPTNARLLGRDLRSISGLEQALDSIALKNETLMTSFPDTWPVDGELVLFKPVYLGKQKPETDAMRRQQSAGGFWIAIDVQRLLSAITTRMSDFSVKVVVAHDDTRIALYEQEARYEKVLYLRWLFPRQQFSQQWETGSSSLTLQFEKETGYTATALLISILSIAVLVSLVLQLNAVRKARRDSERQQRLSREALYEVREMAERTLNAVQDAIVTLNADLRISHINPAAVILFNAQPETTLGRTFDEVINVRLADDTGGDFDLKTALDNLAHSSQAEFDVIPLASTRTDFVLKLTLTSYHNNEGIVTGHVLVMRNISQERQLTRKLAYQANHDALTGCYNRYHFEQKLAGLIDDMAFSDNHHTLCYMDLDQFKIVNDTCGHRAGDRLLIELTEHLRSIIREQDILSRLGGDEFGLILTNTDQQLAKTICNRLFNLFQGFIFHHEDNAFAVRASIGVVNMDSSCRNLKDVMSAADIACYAAKDAGRNSLYVYSADDSALVERTTELRWLPRLQNALQNDEFILYMQPLTSLAPGTLNPLGEPSRQIRHFEFLLRLRNPDGIEFTPWQFIRAAERYDLMRQIDRWVIRNALRTVSELSGGPGRHWSFSINLSGQSTSDPTLADYVREQFEQYKINPKCVWFEVTEVAAISHHSIAIDLFKTLQALGCRIALDDFGSGISSFSYLKYMPIDIIKIDGRFIQGIASNKFDRHMVQAIHQLSQTMGVRTVAEFVENQAVYEEVLSIGIDYAQGYLLGKPASVADTLANYLENWSSTGS